MDVKRLHGWVGFVTVFIFLLTGLYMRWQFPDLYAGNEAARYQYRANHIYLLLAGLLNVSLWLYAAAPASGWHRRLYRLGSALLLAAPALLLAAFFIDPPQAAPERLATSLGLFVLAGGMLCHVAAAFRRKGG